MKLYTWYVYPHTDQVNKIIFEAVERQEFRFCGELECMMLDGKSKSLPLWEVPQHIIKGLHHNRLAKGNFTVFVCENNGEIREFNPTKASKISKEAKKKGLPLKVFKVSVMSPT